MKLTLIQEGLVGCITASTDGLSLGTLEWIACDPERMSLKRLSQTRLRSELSRLEKAGLITRRDGKWVPA